MNAEATLLNLLHTRSTALKVGDKETAYCAIQDLSDATLFRDSDATQARAAKEYEKNFGEILLDLHPFERAFCLVSAIIAARADGLPIESLVEGLSEFAIPDADEENPLTVVLSIVVQRFLERLSA